MAPYVAAEVIIPRAHPRIDTPVHFHRQTDDVVRVVDPLGRKRAVLRQALLDDVVLFASGTGRPEPGAQLALVLEPDRRIAVSMPGGRTDPLRFVAA